MAEAVNHRERILGSIRHALVSSLPAEGIAAEYAAIRRDYVRAGRKGREELIEFFVDRLVDYDAGVYRLSVAEIPGKIAEVLAERGKAGLAVPEGVPKEWLPAGFAFGETQGLDVYELDRAEGVLTGCTVAIAETGTLVLQNAAAQGPRILSLVPDYHLCVVFAEQIVESVPEAFGRLEATSGLPTTFISGPSATADIEMTRIKGVHGPRFLDVLIVG